MMKKLINLCAVLLAGTAMTTIVSCSENNDWTNSWYLAQLLNNGGKTHDNPNPENTSDPEGTSDSEAILASLAHTGCKSKATTRSDEEADSGRPKESVKYEGTEDGYLLLEHINVIFSCITKISATATVSNGIITIVETATSEADCLCPYDLSMKIGPLENKTYEVVICDQTEDSKRISFQLDYNTSVKGVFELKK